MRRTSQMPTARTIDLAPDWAFEGFRSGGGLCPELRAATLFVAAPLGWLIWAGLIYGVQVLLP